MAMVQLRRGAPQQVSAPSTQVQGLPVTKGMPANDLGGPPIPQHATPQEATAPHALPQSHLQQQAPQHQQANILATPVLEDGSVESRGSDHVDSQVPIILKRLAQLHGRIIQHGLVPGSLVEEVLALVSLLRLDCFQHSKMELHRSIQAQLAQFSSASIPTKGDGSRVLTDPQHEAAAAVLSQAWSTSMAVQYACTVLEQCHTLVSLN
jgi:hypothetical protein